jgi:arylsulfatase A-like enzyme
VTRMVPLLALACRGSLCEELARPEPTSASGTPDNVLVVLLDDVGPGQLGRWGVGERVARTPSLDCLCDRGMRFTRAWGHALCSPSRAQLLTGRLSPRTGVGKNILADRQLPEDELTLGEIFGSAGYSTALVGKWHLGGFDSPGGVWGPNLQGFEHFAGSLSNLSNDEHDRPDGGGYRDWLKVEDGEVQRTHKYATTDAADEALDFVRSAPEPWLLVLALHAAHEPLHSPPRSLLDEPLPDEPTPLQRYQAALEAADTELGRVLSSLRPEVWAHTTVVVLGDNGPPRHAIAPPLDKSQHKGTLTEGGLRVPLIVAGPRVQQPGSVSDVLVHEVDLLPTLAELADIELPEIPLDGHSLLPTLSDPQLPARDVMVNVLFGSRNYRERVAVRDEHHKLVRATPGLEQLFAVDDAGLLDGEDLLADGTSSEELEIVTRLQPLLDAVPYRDGALPSP